MSEEREDLIKARERLREWAIAEDKAATGVQGPAFVGSAWGADIIAAHKQRAADLRLLLAHQETSGWREPEGWKLVPVEPTPTMIEVGQRSYELHFSHVAGPLWTAMLAAAPSPPTSQEMT